MSKQKERLARLGRDIFATQANEIHCDEAGILMARCAAALLSDDETQRQYPQLWAHFRFCSNCAEEYRLLLELAQLEAEGQLEPLADIPLPPELGRPALWSRAKDAITALFPGFSPVQVAALSRGEDLALEPVEIELSQGKLSLALDVAINERNSNLRDLFCTFLLAEEQALLEGTSAWLQLDDEGPAVQEQQLNEFGDITFSALPPGRYSLRLHVAGQEYAVTGLLLP